MRTGLVAILFVGLTSFGAAQEEPSDAQALRDQLLKLASPVPVSPTSPTRPKSASSASTKAARSTATQSTPGSRKKSQSPAYPIDGIYEGNVQIDINGNERQSFPALLEVDARGGVATLRIAYSTNEVTYRIRGTLRGNVFSGRCEGHFSGLVYVDSSFHRFRFDRDHRRVEYRSTPLNGSPSTNSSFTTFRRKL